MTLNAYSFPDFFSVCPTLWKYGVWIDMKFLGADSFVLGNKKLLRIFPIKQLFSDNQKFSNWSSLDFLTPGLLYNCLSKNWPVLNILLQKSSHDIQFLLEIGNICHNVLEPRRIESAPKTLMPIQTPDLHRVVHLIRVCMLIFTWNYVSF